MGLGLLLSRILAGGHGLQNRHRQGGAAPAHRRDQGQDPVIRRLRSRSQQRKLGQQQQNDPDHRKAAHMGVLEDFPPAVQVPPGLHRVGHVHVAVQVDAPRHQVRKRAERHPRNQRRKPQPPAEPGQRRPENAHFQPDHGQKQQHPVPGLLVPDVPGKRNGAEHALTHGKSVKVFFHSRKSPLWTTARPADTSITVSQTAASRRSMSARHFR